MSFTSNALGKSMDLSLSLAMGKIVEQTRLSGFVGNLFRKMLPWSQNRF